MFRLYLNIGFEHKGDKKYIFLKDLSGRGILKDLSGSSLKIIYVPQEGSQ